MGPRRQNGASGLMIAVVLMLLALALLAARVVARLGDSADDKNNTIASLQRAQTALDQYVAAGGANARLPCPADPTQDTGLEDPATPTGSCNSTAGTLPWRTIGLRRDDGYDAWGRKISYRVYSGNKGNLTAAGGPSMVNCSYDPSQPNNPGSRTTSAGACKSDHSSTQYDFLSDGKGLKLTDFGVEHSPNTNDPTAYVVISHGPTGFGGYTVSGAQLTSPTGDERDNMRDTGPFHIEAWSDPDTAASSSQHFDDLLAYRTVRDLALRAGIQGRNWIIPAAITGFDATTVTNALTTAAASNAGSTATVDFGAITAQGFAGGTSTAANLVLDTTNSAQGLGVGGGFDPQISSSASESVLLRLDNNKSAQSMAITLNNFGTYNIWFFGTYTYTEHMQLALYRHNTVVDTRTFTACNTGQGLVTFNVTGAPTFDSVRVTPTSAISAPGGYSGDTSFSIAAVGFCTSTTCATGITTAITCP